jgi:hypothetical protein
LERYLTRSKWAKNRRERADRGENTIKNSYLPLQIPDHTRAAWGLNNPAIGLRAQIDFLLGNHMLLLSSNRRPLDLYHCFYPDLENEIPRDGITKLLVRILVITMNQSKTNQHGNMEYGATMRHRDPLCCLIGQLAFWLFYRWQIEDEPFSSFKSGDDWYDLKTLRQSKDRPTGLLCTPQLTAGPLGYIVRLGLRAQKQPTSLEWLRPLMQICRAFPKAT